MKNLSDKQKVTILSIFILVACIGFLLGIFTGLSRKNREINNFNNQDANVFYASIVHIRIDNNNNMHLIVKGLDVNDINYRGNFSFSIDEDTEVLWRYTEIDTSKLKVGQNISITHTGDVLTISPAQLTKVTKINILDDEIEESINNKVTTIDIENSLIIDDSQKKIVTLNQEEIYEIFNIIDNLEFSKETCDGLPSYIIKYNSEKEKGFIIYGLEMYNNSYHITSGENGEAILSKEQMNKIDKILNKYF